MSTVAQQEFFKNLTDQRDFGDKDVESLRREFATIPDKSASAWIEKALTLPEKGEVPPTF